MKKINLFWCFLGASIPLFANAKVDLELIELPDGFEIQVYAEGVDNARQMALGDKGTLFVGSRKAGKLHAVVDDDGDYRADRVLRIEDDLELPSGVVFRDGALYVGDLNRVLKYEFIEANKTRKSMPHLCRSVAK